MTFDEYIKESDRLSQNRNAVKSLMIILSFLIFLCSMIICADKCSDSVAYWIFSLDAFICALFFFIHDYIKQRDAAVLAHLRSTIK